MDEPRAYYTQWGQSKREKQLSFINPYIWIWKDGTDEPIRRAVVEMHT